MKRSRLFIILGIVLLLLILVIGLWRTGGSNRGQSAPSSPGQATLTPMKLALDFTPNPNHTGIYVALKKGWYRQQGIDLTILPFSPNAFPDVLVGANKADVGISGTESVVLDAAAHQNILSIATITTHNTSYLVTRPDAHIQRPRDLDGKIYGGYGAPYEVPIMQKVIEHDGGKGQFKSVTLGTDALQALRSHQVDFAWVFALDIVAAEQDGFHVQKFAVTDYGVPDYYSPTIITSQKEITLHQDLLHRFMKATAQGYEFARSHPQEAAQFLIQTAPKGTFPNPALVLASQQMLSPLYADKGQPWGKQSEEAWQHYVQFILPTGSVKDASGKTVTHLDGPLFTNQFLS
jgi:ABC-type nitrate/sulfonate/bicarbonate transport system substrate-binding protein